MDCDGASVKGRWLLFAPLGMAHSVAETDWHGNYILLSQVWSTALDRRGSAPPAGEWGWEGKRLLPDGWMHIMATVSGPQPATGPVYGATLWLFGPEQGLPKAASPRKAIAASM